MDDRKLTKATNMVKNQDIFCPFLSELVNKTSLHLQVANVSGCGKLRINAHPGKGPMPPRNTIFIAWLSKSSRKCRFCCHFYFIFLLKLYNKKILGKKLA